MLDDLTEVLIRHSSELQTNTPPEVLAQHMVESLRLFEQSLIARSNHPFFRPGQWTTPTKS